MNEWTKKPSDYQKNIVNCGKSDEPKERSFEFLQISIFPVTFGMTSSTMYYFTKVMKGMCVLPWYMSL